MDRYIAAAVLMLVAASSNADAACGPLTVTSVSGTREVHFRDQDGSGGITPGDTRTGEMALVNADGSTAGKIHWLATVQATDADGKPTAYDEVQVFTFDDGAVFTVNRHAPAASFEETTTTIVPTGATRRIVGGTGAYAEASGTMDITVDGLDFTYRFDMTCN
jgi:hypothetical protein